MAIKIEEHKVEAEEETKIKIEDAEASPSKNVGDLRLPQIGANGGIGGFNDDDAAELYTPRGEKGNSEVRKQEAKDALIQEQLHSESKGGKGSPAPSALTDSFGLC